MVDDSKTATDRTPDALQYLAWFLVMSPDESIRDAQYSLELSEAGIELAPHQPILQQIRGMALYRLGRYSSAIVALNRSTAMTGEDADILVTLFLAMAHWQNGHKAEAFDWYRAGETWVSQHQGDNPSVYDFLPSARQQALIEARALIDDQPVDGETPGDH